MKCLLILLFLSGCLYTHAQGHIVDIEQLKKDIKTIQGTSDVSEQMQKQFIVNLKNIVATTIKPSEESLQQFTQDFTGAVANSKPFSGPEMTRLVKNLQVIVASTGADHEIAKAIENIQDVLTASKIKAHNIKKIGQDLQALYESTLTRVVIATFDQDEDGLFDEDEKTALHKALLEALNNKREHRRRRNLEILNLRYVDTDQNGQINNKEMTQFNKDIESILKQRRLEYIAKHDTDGDGILNAEEQQEILREKRREERRKIREGKRQN